jgi:hypothetical protein
MSGLGAILAVAVPEIEFAAGARAGSAVRLRAAGSQEIFVRRLRAPGLAVHNRARMTSETRCLPIDHLPNPGSGPFALVLVVVANQHAGRA